MTKQGERLMDLRVIEVENGYVVVEDNASSPHLNGKTWVASDVADLMVLIGDLAIGTEVRGFPNRRTG